MPEPSRHLDGVGQRLGCLERGDEDDWASHLALELRLKRAGLRKGGFFRNPGPLLGTLAAKRGPVVMFSGHVHQSTAVQFGRSSLVLQHADPAPPSDPNQTVTMLTAPALGQEPDVKRQPPGYFIAHFKEGTLVWLDRRAL